MIHKSLANILYYCAIAFLLYLPSKTPSINIILYHLLYFIKSRLINVQFIFDSLQREVQASKPGLYVLPILDFVHLSSPILPHLSLKPSNELQNLQPLYCLCISADAVSSHLDVSPYLPNSFSLQPNYFDSSSFSFQSIFFMFNLFQSWLLPQLTPHCTRSWSNLYFKRDINLRRITLLTSILFPCMV